MEWNVYCSVSIYLLSSVENCLWQAGRNHQWLLTSTAKITYCDAYDNFVALVLIRWYLETFWLANHGRATLLVSSGSWSGMLLNFLQWKHRTLLTPPHTHMQQRLSRLYVNGAKTEKTYLTNRLNSRTVELWNYVTPYGSHMTAEPLKYGNSKLRCAVSEKHTPDFKGTVLKEERIS